LENKKEGESIIIWKKIMNGICKGFFWFLLPYILIFTVMLYGIKFIFVCGFLVVLFGVDLLVAIRSSKKDEQEEEE